MRGMTPRTGKGGVSAGELLAALGAAIVLASLWRPWYELRFPDEVLSQARAFSTRMGELAPFAQQGIDELQARGSVPLTAWQAFEQADTALAVLACVVLGLVLLNLMGALRARMDGAIVLAGLVAAGVIGFRMVSPPGPDTPFGPDLLHPATALYAGLLGALLIVGGGIAALGRSAAPATPPAPAPPPAAAQQARVWDAS
jgi:hypothetical protein